MTIPTAAEPDLTGAQDDQSGPPTPERAESLPARVIRALLTQRIVLLAVLVVLVVIYFMGLRYNTPLTKTVAIAGFFWLFILFGLTLNDYLTRPWIGTAGR